jgi:pimeloyl-ACP methyl ester carboxylesterase
MEASCIKLAVSGIGTVSIFIKKRGQGSKVLLAHGWHDNNETWRRFADYLSRRYEVWAPDLPAFGKSPPIPIQHTTLQNYAEILEALIEYITEGKGLHGLLGHSMGGLLALLLIQRRPEIARKVSVCGAPAAGVRYLKPLADHHGFVTGCLRVVQAIPLARWFFGNADVYAAAALLKEVCACSLLNQLKPVSAHIQVTRGEHDPYVSPAVARQTAEKLHAQFYEFQGAFHTPMVDRPEEFYRIVGSFLDSIPL